MVNYRVRYQAVEYVFGKGIVYHMNTTKSVNAKDIQDIRAKLLKEYKTLYLKYGTNLEISVSVGSFNKGRIMSTSKGIFWEEYPSASRYHLYPSGRVSHDIRYYAR